MAEQADAHDSKSCTLGYVGSIPTFGNKKPLSLSERLFIAFIGLPSGEFDNVHDRFLSVKVQTNTMPT